MGNRDQAGRAARQAGVPAADLHERFANDLFDDAGLDLWGQRFNPFFVADLIGASSVEFTEGQLAITIWKPGEGERVVRKEVSSPHTPFS